MSGARRIFSVRNRGHGGRVIVVWVASDGPDGGYWSDALEVVGFVNIDSLLKFLNGNDEA